MNATILIVEDEKAIMNSLKIKLQRAGYTVIEATDGVEGLEFALKEHPRLILLDIVMPRKDGMTMLSKLRQDAWGKTAKVVFLTNLSNEKKELEAQKYGVTDYIIKTDISLVGIVEKVKSFME